MKIREGKERSRGIELAEGNAEILEHRGGQVRKAVSLLGRALFGSSAASRETLEEVGSAALEEGQRIHAEEERRELEAGDVYVLDHCACGSHAILFPIQIDGKTSKRCAPCIEEFSKKARP